MASNDTTFTDFVTLIAASWLNDVNIAVYRAIGTGTGGVAPTTPAAVLSNLGMNSGAFEWIKGPTPTFVNTTSFTVTGNQTALFPTGRRVRTTNTGGTVYSYVTSSSFAAVTTVNLLNDSGVLDSGISAVDFGILNPTNYSIPAGVSSPGFNAKNNADQTSGTTALFQTAVFNRNSMLNVATGVVTAPITADYVICGAVSITNTSGGALGRILTLTGSTAGIFYQISETVQNSSTQVFPICVVQRLVTNETFSVVFNSAFTAAFLASNGNCWLSARIMP